MVSGDGCYDTRPCVCVHACVAGEAAEEDDDGWTTNSLRSPEPPLAIPRVPPPPPQPRASEEDDVDEIEAPKPARATRPDARYMERDDKDVLYRYGKDYDLE